MNQRASPFRQTNLLAMQVVAVHGSRPVLTVLLLLTAALMWSGAALATAPRWIEQGSDGEARVHLYFFWSETCPHCLEAHPFIAAIPVGFPSNAPGCNCMRWKFRAIAITPGASR
jgi:hypothetical protein